jgi:hypothetical protein
MNYYQLYKYTNDPKEYYEAFNKNFSAKVVIKTGTFLIQFDEVYDPEEAEHLCRLESRNFSTRCFVSNNSKQIFLTDYSENFKKEVE